MRPRCLGWVGFSLAVLFLPNLKAIGQRDSPAAIAPVPSALYNAKKVFVSNAGADSGLFPHPFSGDPDRGYNEFYADVQGLKRFERVTDPADADLVLELKLNAPSGPANADKQKGASDPLPMFRLVVWDRKTHFVLWALTESVDPATLQKTHDHNFDVAIAALAQEFRNITTPAPTTTP